MIDDIVIPDPDNSINISTIDLSNSDYPEFIYMIEPDYELTRAFYDGSNWMTENLGLNGGTYTCPVEYCNSESCSRLLCMDTLNFKLNLYVEEELNWTESVIENGESAGWQNSLFVDSNGTPHVVYINEPDQQLYYAVKNNDSWMKLPVDIGNAIGSKPAIMADSDGHAHITFYNRDEKELRYATGDESVWTITTIDSTSDDVGENPVMDIDENGHIHIAYIDAENSQIKHAWYDGSDWSLEVIEDKSLRNSSLSIACGGNDVHISYMSQGDVVYLVRNGGLWDKEIVTTEDRTSYHSSIDIDSSGTPHIAYHDFYNMDVKYAVKTGENWEVEMADSDEFVGDSVRLKLDPNDNPHIAYVRSCADIAVKYSFKDDAGWHHETLTTSRENVAISLNPEGLPCITYQYYGLRYASRNLASIPPAVGIRLMMPSDYYYANKPFSLDVALYNNGDPLENVPAFVFMQIGDEYFFFPSWRKDADWIEIPVPSGISKFEILTVFQWPDTGDDGLNGIVFWAALLNENMTEILGGMDGMDMKIFGFGQIVSCEN